MPGDIFSGFNAIQNANIPMPQGSAPAIATLGNMIDALEQRRMARDKEAQAQANFELQQRKQDAISAYHTRRLDLQDQRDTSKSAFDRAKYNQDLIQKAQGSAAKGLHPGTQLFMDDQGNPIRVAPRFVPNEPAPAPSAPGGAPSPTQQPLIRSASFGSQSPNAIAQMVGQNPDADSADELGLGPKLSPEETQAVGQKRDGMLQSDPGGTIDLDTDVPEEVGLNPDSPEAQAIEAKRAQMLQSDPGGNIDLANPTDYQAAPPSEKTPAPDLHSPGQEAQENEQPHAELMSPEASGKRLDELGVSPLPPREAPPSYQGLQDALANRGSNVPQADAAQPAAEFKRGKWVYDMPNGQPFEIDMEQARQAHLEEVKAKVAQIDSALADPSTLGLKMEDVMNMRRMRAMMLGDLAPNERSALLAQGGRADLQTQKEAGLDSRLDKTLGSREKIAEDRNANALKIAEMKKRKVGNGLAKAKASDPTNSANNPWAMLDSKERTREGNRLNRELRDWSRMQGWDKLLSTNIGRLDWASENIALTGPGAGASQAEAMMNLFGAARGGVPVKNETDEFYKNTSTLKSMLNALGPKIGIPGLGAKLSMGELTEQEKQQYADGVSSMPEEQRSAIERAIKSTSASLLKYGKTTLGSLKTLWDNEPVANRYKATSFMNELGSHVGLQPQQWWGDVPLNGGGQASAAPSAAQPQQMGKMSLDDALQKLLQAKGAK